MDSDPRDPNGDELEKCKTEIKLTVEPSENRGQITSTEKNMDIVISAQESTETKPEELEQDAVNREQDVTSIIEDVDDNTAKDVIPNESNSADERTENKDAKDEPEDDGVKSNNTEDESAPEMITKRGSSLMGYRGDDEKSDSDSDSSSDDDSSSEMETSADGPTKSDKLETKDSERYPVNVSTLYLLLNCAFYI